MNANRQSHKEGNQYNPAVGAGAVSLLVPLCHRPEYNGGEEGRHRVNLSLNGGEPESVGETVGKGPYGSGTHYGH